jgi:hypothetical protein
MKLRYLLSIVFVGIVGLGNAQTVQEYTSAGTFTWTCPAGVNTVLVECVGGGGAGGSGRGNNNQGAGGGAGGQYASSNVGVNPGDDYTVRVAAQTNGPVGNYLDGSTGDYSQFSIGATIHARAMGGAGGIRADGTRAGGTGNTTNAIGNIVVRAGGNGSAGTDSNSGAGGGGAGSGGNGGNASGTTAGTGTANFGGNGGAGRTTSGAGNAGSVYGGGGGGARRHATGGAGARGYVRVTYTCPVITPNAGPDQVMPACSTSTTLAGSAVPTGAIGTWTVISGTATITTPSSPTTTVTGMTLGQTVTLRWSINNHGCGITFDEMTITTSQGPGCLSYCTPNNLNCTFSDIITNVVLETLTNNSGATCNNPSGYSDYSSTTNVPNLLIGNSYTLTITVGAGTGTHYAGVWLDFNANGSLMDENEFFPFPNAITPNTTHSVTITVPPDAIEGVTRMRIRYTWNEQTLSAYACNTFMATYGETEDYSVNILCPVVPSDVTGKFPANGLPLPCGAATFLSWGFNRCVDGYKLYMDQNNPPTTLISDSFGPNDLNYYTGNLSGNTTYYWRVVPFNSNGDGSSSVWSFTTQTPINTAISQDEDGCGEGGITLTASGGAFPDYYWYTVPLGGTPIHEGVTYTPVGLTEPTYFHVANVYEGPSASINAASAGTINCTNSNADGVFINVYAKSANINVTSLDIFMKNLSNNASATNRPVKVYYRPSTYQGNAFSNNGWIEVFNGTFSLPQNFTGLQNVDITDVFIPAGQTYSFYMHYAYFVDAGANIYSNADIEVRTGAINCGSGEFGNLFYPDYSFRGTVNYNITCTSPTVPVLATPYVSPNEVTLALTSVTGAEEQCTEAGWTYYAHPSSPTEWLFAIAKNGNTFTATVDIYEQALPFEYINSSNNPHGSELMSRYWNVNVTSGSVVNPVGVRFFFDEQEITDAFNLRNTTKALFPGTFDVPWRWFKTTSGNFNHLTSPIDGNIFGFANITPTASMPLNINGAGYTGYINGVAYVEFSGLTSFSGGGGGFGFSTWENVALPVEMLSFTGQDFEDYNQLFWSTASEINNEYFVIERSANGENFAEVGRVQGAGNSTQTLHYTLKDYNFSPTTYYRLKQVDFDGTATYHNVVVVQRKDFYGKLSLTVFPNPTNGELTIRAQTLNEGEYEIRVVNTLGMLVHQERTYLAEGVNDYTVDFGHLAKGIYSIEVNSTNERKVIRFVKQ